MKSGIEMCVYLFVVISFTFGCKLAVGLVDAGQEQGPAKGIVKRHDLDFSTCLNSFDVHQDKIIRTQDSRAMGAKYINERDVPSREDCLRLCCETSECDVFVYEEKDPGSCYLFQCGTPEDFKCKFTKHRNYTSAVLSSNHPMTELESQIKLTQHEHELTKLRKPELLSSVSIATLEPSIASTTAVPQGSKETAQIIPTSSNTDGEVQNRHCSRYQFECRSSGECIGIYNACDGIPQCSDGSDEAPELGCPAQAASTPTPLAKTNPAPGENIVAMPSATHKVADNMIGHNGGSVPQPSGNQPQPSTSLNEDSQLTMPVLSKQFKTNQWTPQMYGASIENQHAGNTNNFLPNVASQQSMLGMSINQQLDMQQVQNQQIQELQQPSPQLVNQAKIYGREGEGLLYHPGGDLLPWPPYQQEQNIGGPYHSASNGNSQIFSHKGNGLVSQTDRYRQSMTHMVPQGGGGKNGQYEPLQNDFSRYNNYYENSPPYRGVQQGQIQNNWQMMHKPHEMNSLNNMEENGNLQGPNVPQNIPLPGPGQDYYYEESFRTRVQPQMIPKRIAAHTQPAVNVDITRDKAVPVVHHTETLPASLKPVADIHNKDVSVKKAEVDHSVTVNATTVKPKEVNHDHHHSSHRKMEQLTAELTLSESSFDSDIDQQNVSPRGAILSLTMGMCVTGIMLVLVGCRMRMVRRRLRRGSKSPYAHDADFLVNGMYL